MLRKVSIIVLCIQLITTVLSGQCPDRTVLYNRIIYLRDSSKISPEQQLAELLPYDSILGKCQENRDSTYALLLQRIGAIYNGQQNYVSAIDFFNRSIAILHEGIGKPYINQDFLVRCYYTLNISYGGLKHRSMERESADSCIAVSFRLKTGYFYSMYLLGEKVAWLFSTGDYYRCMEFADIGLGIIKDYKGPLYNPGPQRNSLLTYKMNCLVFLKRFPEVESALDRVIRSLPRRSDSLGSIYGLYARTMVAKGNYDKALQYYDSSIYYNSKVHNTTDCAGALNNIGYTIYFKGKNQPGKALQYYYKALAYHDPVESLNILDNIANIYAGKGQFDSALHFFQLAFDQIKKGSTEVDLVNYFRNREVKTITGYITGLILDKADTYLLQYKATKQAAHLDQTIQAYKTADQVLGLLKLTQPDMESALFWRENNRRLYEHAIDACFLAGKAEEAFYFFEKSRAVLLSDQLKDQRWLASSDILKLSQVKKELLELSRQKDTTHTDDKNYAALQRDIIIHEQELERLQQLIRQRNPLWYQSVLDTTLAGLPEVRQKLLKDHQALLEIFNGDNTVYTLLITADQASLHVINKKTFDTTVQRYLSFIADPVSLNLQFNQFSQTAYNLYQLLFRDDRVPQGRIIISPDGKYFPFESLLSGTGSPSPAWFLNDHAISYTFSANFLLNDFNRNTSGNGFMGVAPVNFPAAVNLATLYESDVSIKKIGHYFGNPYNIIGSNATRGNFLQQFSSYQVIQLYAHASDSSDHGEPVIYFVDSAMYLSDLIPADKPATRLIVLSACETASGKLYQGEGTFSFSRGFAAMGIPSSITNLWVIDNKATYRLTELFYKYLSEKDPSDIALQKAKLEFIRTASGTERLPYYWGATILAGKTDSIDYSKPFNWAILLTAGGVALLLLIIVAWRINAGRKKRLPVSSLHFNKQYNSN